MDVGRDSRTAGGILKDGFIFNLTKLPVYIALTALNPSKPLLTATSLTFDLLMFPVILVGVFVGKWFLQRVPQRVFDALILVLAAVASIKLIT